MVFSDISPNTCGLRATTLSHGDPLVGHRGALGIEHPRRVLPLAGRESVSGAGHRASAGGDRSDGNSSIGGGAVGVLVLDAQLIPNQLNDGSEIR